MGMHFGLIVTPANPQEIIDSWKDIFLETEITATHTGFTSENEFSKWMLEKENIVKSKDWSTDNLPINTYAIWKDGKWSVILDSSYIMAIDDKILSEISRRFGKALAFVVESAGGTAVFICYENGELIRKIEYFDGYSNLTGTPLAEEAGINVEQYYMDGTEALLSAFGINLKNIPILDSAISLAVIDKKDYGALRKRRNRDQPPI